MQILEANNKRNGLLFMFTFIYFFFEKETVAIQFDKIIYPGTSSILTSNSYEIIEITFNFKVARQQIYYIQPMLEILKFAWVKYLSLLIPLYLLGNYLLRVGAEKKVFESVKHDNLPMKKLA